ncbi:hypothetical protein CEXT_677151 [Caerostris extrusa]|uniref:Secreted protein n=1 Tax=Caerostris extrusa TaxID=172846 RepID=A0AAV4NK11_CAEEX|nr:hypothetical protein CEXT_677151 [Caerostris extrusa]
MSSLHATILFSTVQKAIAHTHNKNRGTCPVQTRFTSPPTDHCARCTAENNTVRRYKLQELWDTTITGSSIRQAARPNRD